MLGQWVNLESFHLTVLLVTVQDENQILLARLLDLLVCEDWLLDGSALLLRR